MTERIWKIVRVVLSALLLLAVALPSAFYILLSTPFAQNYVRDIAAEELSNLLGAEVAIKQVTIHPFNRLSIEGVSLDSPEPGEKRIADIREISAGVELFHFLKTGEIIIDYALLEEARIAISRPSPDEPLNIAPIIARLKSGKQDRPSAKFDLRINTVVLHNSSLTYDILSEPVIDSMRMFDKNHIEISNINLNAYIPRLSNECYRGEIDHLSFREKCGFEVKKLTAKATFSTEGAELDDFSLTLNETHIALAPTAIAFDGFDNIQSALQSQELKVTTIGTNHIYPPDFAPFVPMLASLDKSINFSFNITGNTKQIDINSLILYEKNDNLFDLDLKASLTDLDKPVDSIGYTVSHLSIDIEPDHMVGIIPFPLPEKAQNIINSTTSFHINAYAIGRIGNGSARFFAGSKDIGNIKFDGSYTYSTDKHRGDARGRLDFTGVNLGILTENAKLGLIDGSIAGHSAFSKSDIAGELRISADSFDFNNHTYNDISIEIEASGKNDITYKAESTDPDASFNINGNFSSETKNKKHLTAEIDIENLDFSTAGISKNSSATLHGQANINICGRNIDDISGTVALSDIVFNKDGKELRLNRFEAERLTGSNNNSIRITSDYINGEIDGTTTFSTLTTDALRMASTVTPSALNRMLSERETDNNFTFDFTIDKISGITDALGFKTTPVYPTTISGHFNSTEGTANIDIDSPYLRNGNKYITNTSANVRLNAVEGKAQMYVSSEIPTKKGLMALGCVVNAHNDTADAHIDWTIEREIPINGIIDFSTSIGRDLAGAIAANLQFNPGTINFGDDVWNITPSEINYANREIRVDNFALSTKNQTIAIDGTVGDSETDSLTIDLHGINMLPIFETLEIDKALISGRAKGRLVAKQIMTPAPVLYSQYLHVDSIGYNRCTLGNADVNAIWDNEKKAFTLDADITEPEGLHSKIYGDIYPLTESLDITFDANHVRVGFMKPFMEAFTSDITGYVSGHARLFGTFKEIDLEGDIFADNLRIKIDFTNTWYSATDSIHVVPGRIDIKNITILDVNGHTALLNGYVSHTFFKQPVFRFDITEARDFLSFNGTPRQNPDWYGTIYGNGGASITGRPGIVDIGVKMSTAPGSKFTFVLSDRLDADEYTFINFRDCTPAAPADTITSADDTPEEFLQYLQNGKHKNTDKPSAYNMDISVDITPDAKMILVMDPVGGDQIKATGSGNMRMIYNSIDNSIFMQGKYTLDQGSYNFTLQDIIIKDFTIDEGSTISFSGDPYRPEADITAYYALNANLTDLDESFAQDKDISRTNVPVHAIMKVSGDIRQPAIDFDLGFPTLTQDTYRKVRSIVSTREMMNRQIIYLLALNRFYTPDYMASTTKGNELFSVASSTISSQLGNMLGKLSENWSIAPNLRSDRGDFSDVEVDVALSSRLLNNRLLFNGNFGYRDKLLNNNQFIGDFDIEYLLNRRGSLRLKAYNRYNDRNYYVRSAQTTQGVGIMFKRDFDNLFSFLRRKKKAGTNPESEPEKISDK